MLDRGTYMEYMYNLWELVSTHGECLILILKSECITDHGTLEN